MLYALWDLGLKVGQATRSVEETMPPPRPTSPSAPPSSRRATSGASKNSTTISRRRSRPRSPRAPRPNSSRDKLAERNERHLRLGDSRYLVEPNVKEGKGGLRDLHTLFWIAKYIYRVDDVAALVDLKVLSAKEAQRFARAQDFLWTVRCQLHFLAGPRRGPPDLRIPGRNRPAHGLHRPCRHARRRTLHEALFPHRQGRGRSDAHLLRAPGIRADQASRCSRWRRWRAREKKLDGFRVASGRIDVDKDSAFRDDPINLIRMFQLAEEHELDIHPACAAPHHAILEADRQRSARESRGQPPVHGDSDLAQGPRGGAAPHERGRRVRPLRARFRPRRGADAIRHVSHLHRRRAHALRHRPARQDREGRAQGRAAAGHVADADDFLAPRALSRRAAARHRQGPRRRPFDPGRGDRA